MMKQQVCTRYYYQVFWQYFCAHFRFVHYCYPSLLQCTLVFCGAKKNMSLLTTAQSDLEKVCFVLFLYFIKSIQKIYLLFDIDIEKKKREGLLCNLNSPIIIICSNRVLSI